MQKKIERPMIDKLAEAFGVSERVSSPDFEWLDFEMSPDSMPALSVKLKGSDPEVFEVWPKELSSFQGAVIESLGLSGHRVISLTLIYKYDSFPTLKAEILADEFTQSDELAALIRSAEVNRIA